MKNEIENYLKGNDKVSWYAICALFITFLGQIKTTVKEIMTPFELGEGGTFVHHYPLNTKDMDEGPRFSVVLANKFIATKTTLLNNWLIQVANNMITGDYSAFGNTVDQEWLADNKQLGTCQQDKQVKTVKEAKEYLFSTNYNWQNGDARLTRYMNCVIKSMKKMKNDAYKANKKVAFGQKQSQGPVLSPDGTQVLINGQWRKLA